VSVLTGLSMTGLSGPTDWLRARLCDREDYPSASKPEMAAGDLDRTTRHSEGGSSSRRREEFDVHPNAESYRRLTAAFQTGDFDAVGRGQAVDVQWEEAGEPMVVDGRDAVLRRMTGAIAHVEARIDVHDVLADDEHVVAMLNVSLRGPDGSELSYAAVEIAHMSDGRVTERWSFMDSCPSEVDAFFSDHSSRSG
jgi:ketosteroid isomerase-like protein